MSEHNSTSLDLKFLNLGEILLGLKPNNKKYPYTQVLSQLQSVNNYRLQPPTIFKKITNQNFQKKYNTLKTATYNNSSSNISTQ